MKKRILIPIYHPRDYFFYEKIAKKLKTQAFIFLFFFDYSQKKKRSI